MNATTEENKSLHHQFELFRITRGKSIFGANCWIFRANSSFFHRTYGKGKEKTKPSAIAGQNENLFYQFNTRKRFLFALFQFLFLHRFFIQILKHVYVSSVTSSRFLRGNLYRAHVCKTAMKSNGERIKCALRAFY